MWGGNFLLSLTVKSLYKFRWNCCCHSTRSDWLYLTVLVVNWGELRFVFFCFVSWCAKTSVMPLAFGRSLYICLTSTNASAKPVRVATSMYLFGLIISALRVSVGLVVVCTVASPRHDNSAFHSYDTDPTRFQLLSSVCDQSEFLCLTCWNDWLTPLPSAFPISDYIRGVG